MYPLSSSNEYEFGINVKLSFWGGMRHLLILIWIKVYYNKNSFTGLEFKNFTKNYVLKNLLKGKNNKSPSEIWTEATNAKGAKINRTNISLYTLYKRNKIFET